MTRKQRRALAHANRNTTTTTPPSVPVTNNVEEPVTAPSEGKPPISAAQLAANRANALLSTGPSEAGKRRSSQNALKTGLTGRQVLLPEDDAVQYEAMVREYKDHFLPVGPEETALVHEAVLLQLKVAELPRRQAFETGAHGSLKIEFRLGGGSSVPIAKPDRLRSILLHSRQTSVR